MSILKYLLFLTVLAFLTPNTLAQKCNYEKNEIDGLLEIPIKRTASEMLCRIDNQPFYIKAQCIGDNKYLKLIYYKYNGFVIKDDREIGLILPGNDELTLFPRVMPVDTAEIDDIMDMTTLIIYKLSTDQYETLKNIPVIKFKYFINGGFIVKDIKASKQPVIMQLLRCVE